MAFADCFPASSAGRKILHSAPEALAALPYDEELELKNQAFAAFCKEAHLPVPAAVCPSPRSCAYRSTGKRRISCKGGKVFLHLGRTPGKELIASSLLEPQEHALIYNIVQKQLSLPRSRAAAEAANYCIVRGADKDRTLILNVRHLSGEIVRALRATAEAVREAVPAVQSAFLYVDETGSDYYLEAERPEGKLGWKKLFGPEKLSLRIGPKKFLYPPAVFSQINESILPVFAEALGKELSPQVEDQLLDLYCGYGLWSLLLAERVRSVWGAELSMEAVRAARANAAYHFPEKNMHYECGSLDGEFLREKVPAPRGKNEIILLDPPRHGALPDVLEHIISRRPRLAAYIFCGTDEIPGTLHLCKSNGCRILSLRPFDFFPGTLNIETLAVLQMPGTPARQNRSR